MLGFSFDLAEQLTFYGSYHNNPINKIIHMIFVPTIWATAAVWFCYTPALVDTTPKEVAANFGITLPAIIADNIEFDVAFVLFACYALYYLTLDFFAGLTFDVVLFCLYLGANVFVNTIGREQAWQYALGLHVFGWYMQIHPGHGIFEGRKPALFDSLLQALVLAPLFVWFEVLFPFGYRKSLHAEVQKRVDENIRKFRQSQGKKNY
eukprot:TRINITY_DN867_c0_g1::TRINITY_DN867_c0_g1_i1::g.25325::m.25325 TRINITY_DN867_c0_g1::TRINITY_DN867_c0_g1_i1::g.25325  ORF type:complete len:220 (-),score=56.47,sp/O13737/YDR2_SCHPO/33.33/8e-20,DUF962/PF06127.6/9.2e-25 TRINITY_DN867_c0_g1_i1:130-750(-)